MKNTHFKIKYYCFEKRRLNIYSEKNILARDKESLKRYYWVFWGGGR